MSEFFKWLSSNPLATTILIISFGSLATFAIVVYLVAFFQGREISFWPPKIGAKPEKLTGINKEKVDQHKVISTPIAQGTEHQLADTLPEKEMLERISTLELGNADLRAQLTFEERINTTDGHAINQDLVSDISHLFLIRDEAVVKHDEKKFLETQLDKLQISGGYSRGYVKCSKMTTTILKVSISKPKSNKKTVNKDYDHDFKFSHSGYIIYEIRKTDSGLKILALNSLNRLSENTAYSFS